MHLDKRFGHVPRSSAVTVENVEILAGQQFAAIDAGLNGSKTPQDAYLLHIAHQWHNVQAL